ncbi:pirin family protein [Turicibacter sanguinis]|nr:pirin family protein [Turicibacter sanguinis]MTN82612.1 pirin family protein [Turicibacter sanguinis]MTN85710.1 pirin family protein [Turicibacter sanguinis]MTN88343.1 pirin family protein [Turicibacter sanguinis]MTN91635.1 pirin family protein [Turicibacter sanguinis]
MIKKIDHTLLGTAYHTWLQSLFHFSYADYYQPYINKFGVIRVINDDILHVNSGHDLHKHKDVEIITYMISGELTHTPKIGMPKKLTRGELYYMSAGSGMEHAEFNWGEKPVRMIQLWIRPNQKNVAPKVEYGCFKREQRFNQWQKIVSDLEHETPIQIHQEVNIWVSEVEANRDLDFDILKNRQAYLIQLEGESMINNIAMSEKDGMEIFEEPIKIKTVRPSLFMIIEMNINGK